ncbi:ABC transporter permease [Bacteroidota bacterium]
MEAVFINRFRSILTALGIIFGVAAVIAMLAVGNGAKQETLEQIKLVGVNNIVILPVEKEDQKKNDNQEEDGNPLLQKRFSPGLTLKDVKSIRDIIPNVERISPEVIFETHIIKDGIRKQAILTGVTPDFFDVYNLDLKEGTMFNEVQLREGKPVCILGEVLKSKFFPNESPVGKKIKTGNIWLEVIGVLENRSVSITASENFGISDYNNNIYAPIQTLLLRFKDRSMVTSKSLQDGEIFYTGNSVIFLDNEEDSDGKTNQLDKIVVQLKESKYIKLTEKILHRMLKRRHVEVEDYRIVVPELELKQERETEERFNIVLGAIASISLIVGGIGIMNIMLASVMERIKEIGIRMATGARRKDIIFQFLTEATLISITGGLIGIVLGIVLSKIITYFFDILTIISPISIFISFFVSASVGIVFGYMPAKKAAEQDPVISLRHE